MEHFLPLLLDGPFQAWGHSSRFMRRTTGLYPTKSGVIGLVAAAMGLAKGCDEERKRLPQLAALEMTAIALPRPRSGVFEPKPEEQRQWLEPRRLEDYHTVAFTREANAKPKRISDLEAKCLKPITPTDRGSEIKPTQRQYLMDARYGVIIKGPHEVLATVAAALRNPHWGVWLGRKNCIPASPVFAGGPFGQEREAWGALLPKAGLPAHFLQTQFDQVVEAPNGFVSLSDHPISFGNGQSSGPDFRQFSPRRVKIIPRTQ